MSDLKLNLKKKIWITSDTHYGHKNLCRGSTNWCTKDGEIPIGSTRDFNSLDKMNDTIVNNINSCVEEDDILIHAGDLSFGGVENIKKFIKKLNVKEIHFVNGNHDSNIEKNRENTQDLFTSVHTRIDLQYNKTLIIIDHYPLLSWKKQRRGSIMLHGHSHLVGDSRFGFGKKMDIGIDGHPEFRPYNLEREIIPLMEKRDVISEYSTIFDHHINKTKYKQ